MSCSKDFTSGTYTGHLTDIIDRDGWDHTTFILETIDGDKGCVQVTASNQTRNKIINNAFLLDSLVTLSVDKYHTVTGIGYRNDG